MNLATVTLHELGRLPVGALEAVLAQGHPVEPRALAGFEYHGLNVGAPALAARLFRKFRKVFALHEPSGPGRNRSGPEIAPGGGELAFGHIASGRVRGWNLRSRQNAPDEPWIDAPPIPGRGGPVALVERAVELATGLRGASAAHGLFEARARRSGDRLRCPGGAVILDYRGAGNPPGDVTARLLDYAVAVRPGDPTLLIGRAYYDLGVLVDTAPAVFLLERAGPIRDSTPAGRRA